MTTKKERKKIFMRIFQLLSKFNDIGLLLLQLLHNKIAKPESKCYIRQWSTKNWRFEEWFNSTLKNNKMRCKKISTNVSGRKNLARSFKRSQVNTSAEI